MPVANLVLLVLALLATLVMAVGWLQDPAAPMPGEWFVAKVSEGGPWAGLFLTLLAVVFLGWRRTRSGRKARSPN
jgi:hypothetical protein